MALFSGKLSGAFSTSCSEYPFQRCRFFAAQLPQSRRVTYARRRSFSAPELMSDFHPFLPLAPVGSPRVRRVRSMFGFVELNLALATRTEPSPAVGRLDR